MSQKNTQTDLSVPTDSDDVNEMLQLIPDVCKFYKSQNLVIESNLSTLLWKLPDLFFMFGNCQLIYKLANSSPLQCVFLH